MKNANLIVQEMFFSIERPPGKDAHATCGKVKRRLSIDLTKTTFCVDSRKLKYQVLMSQRHMRQVKSSDLKVQKARTRAMHKRWQAAIVDIWRSDVDIIVVGEILCPSNM